MAAFMPKPGKVGRPWVRPMRLVFDGMLYVLHVLGVNQRRRGTHE